MSSIAQPSSLCGDKLLLFFPRQPDPQWVSSTKANHPGLDVLWVCSLSDDGQDIDPEKLPEHVWQGTTLLFVDWIPPPAHLFPDVRFVQLASAGADHWHGHEAYEDPAVSFCNASGSYSLQIAEWVIGAWLMHQRRFVHYQIKASAQQWSVPVVPDTEDSFKLRMGILGYGSIGRQCARLATALGMDVYAYTRTARTTAELRREDGERRFSVAGTGDPDGVLPKKWFHGSSQASVDDFLGQELDVLFSIMSKKKTFVINVARGRHVDTEALISALNSGEIRGAALDVTDPEPLPPGHPLWSSPNVFISPHVSWWTKRVWERSLSLLETNINHLSRNTPLINQLK